MNETTPSGLEDEREDVVYALYEYQETDATTWRIKLGEVVTVRIAQMIVGALNAAYANERRSFHYTQQPLLPPAE